MERYAHHQHRLHSHFTAYRYSNPKRVVATASQGDTISFMTDERHPLPAFNLAPIKSSHMATNGTMINKKINEIHQTSYFEDWLDSVKDAQGKSAILARLDRAADGNFGDCEPVGDGVSEMRVFIGPGYRIYFVRSGIAEYLMLSGSDKADQKRGIKRAKAILDALRGK